MLKRLRYYFDCIANRKTTTYPEVYAAKVTYAITEGGERIGESREPTHWHNGVAYTVLHTHKLAQDRPTVIVSIPVEKLKINRASCAAADFCLRSIKPYFEAINAQYANRSRPDRDNGKFYVHAPGPQVLLRNTAYFAMQPAPDFEIVSGGNRVRYIDPPPEDVFCLHIRMEVQLPYLLLDRAKKMLCVQMPKAVEDFIEGFDMGGLDAALALEHTQQSIRAFLQNSAYCAFIANGSILAREQDSDKPGKNAVPFQSPPGHEIEIAGIRGMGIKRGVTVITGGGYSGKSTVLNAVSAGIYNHIAGDGRELCITDDTAATITAEDGRAVSCVNISPFIKWLPGGDPRRFSAARASGSTSQGANIMEAVALGAKLLLIDEDRSATNFMIRDAVMKELIAREPITPFTDRVRELADKGVSTLLVIGGSGEYLSVADHIFIMDEYVCEASERAKALVPPPAPKPAPACWDNHRALSKGFSAYPMGTARECLSVSDTGFIIIGDERIDIRNLHNIATALQVNALAFMLRYLAKSFEDSNTLEAMALAMRGLSPKGDAAQAVDICGAVEKLYGQIETDGLNLTDTGFFTTMCRFMEMPRRFELLAAINRMRYAQWHIQTNTI